MTMIVARCGSRNAFIAFSSRLRVSYSDESVRYEDVDPMIRTHPTGFVAASGEMSVAQAAVEHVAAGPGGTLDEIATSLAPELACLASGASNPDTDPARTRVFILTIASGTAELGLLSAKEGLQRFEPTTQVLSDPGDVEGGRERVLERWKAYEAETSPPGSGYALLRSLSRFYDDVAGMAPTVAADFTVGLMQLGPNGWERVWLRGPTDLAGLPDAEISNRMAYA